VLTQQSSDIESFVTVSLNTVFCNVVNNLNEYPGIQGSLMIFYYFFYKIPNCRQRKSIIITFSRIFILAKMFFVTIMQNTTVTKVVNYLQETVSHCAAGDKGTCAMSTEP